MAVEREAFSSHREEFFQVTHGVLCKWSVNRILRVRIPVPVEASAAHTCPNHLAPVMIEEACGLCPSSFSN